MKFTPVLLIIFLWSCNPSIQYPEGGYNYPAMMSASDTNFYFYPIKDLISRRDSFIISYGHLFYQRFDEPNISLRPLPEETFRFTYEEVFGNTVIITITPNRIIIKEGNPGDIFNHDESRFTKTENTHLYLLKKRFPIDTTEGSSKLRKYLDSMIRLYPQLLDVAYYHSLYKRTIVNRNNKSAYSTTSLHLSNKQYYSLIHDINASGFWSLPQKISCSPVTTDGYGFIMEANTKMKYNIVRTNGCPGDTTKFTKACQKIIELAKLDKKIDLLWTN